METFLLFDCRENQELVKQLSLPTPGSKELNFPTRFPQNGWEQFKACLWKHHLSYWRSPSYNLTRIVYMMTASILFGAVFWQHGKKMLVFFFSFFFFDVRKKMLVDKSSYLFVSQITKLTPLILSFFVEKKIS